jgi:hypothetical protein
MEHGGAWDASFTFSESELVDVLTFVSGMAADNDAGAERGACASNA